MDDATPEQPHKRRVRYRGTHPHRFDEKYKELNPEKYAADVEHVISRGDTPAGTHRSICLAEVLDILNPQPGEIAVDATLGYGGHSQEILKRILPDGILFGLDVDSIELQKTETRLRNAGFGPERFIAVHSNFTALQNMLPKVGHPAVDMILADLGVSSMQIDNPKRGFAYKNEGPLDMRMDQEKGETVAHLLSHLSEAGIAALLHDNADEPNAKVIARGIVGKRQEMTTTRALSKAVKLSLAGLNLDDKAVAQAIRRTFQALRIVVNGEFSALEAFLSEIPYCLKSGGRAVILTFHSGEDNRVVDSFEKGKLAGLYSRTQDAEIRASNEEKYSNPRSKSVRLRWAIRS
ncbi:MAG: 16S rRNA (cytosine(1402)-N(4))-methyltransferase RsmH [Spirochaetes bacterium]|nr:16S rRNA (cytosine(1402)-N(4))-methyltransferase RsmH [Spirochaetota bacterium]